MIRSMRRAAAGVGVALLSVTVGLGATAKAGVTAAAGVPKGFKANSITWLSAQQGWVLGAAPCGQQTCSDVIGTTDGAQTWRLVGPVKAPIAQLGDSTRPGVVEIRFATPDVGWAFEPRLFRTIDGGHTWSKMTIPGGGKQVLALAANSSGAFAIVSTCQWGMGLCNHLPLTLWHTDSLTGTSWTRIPLKLPANVIGPDVAVFGKTVYVVDPQVDVTGAKDKFYASTDDGLNFAARPVPCDKRPDTALWQVVPTSATHVALLCVGNPGLGKSDKLVYRSKTTGKTDTYAGIMNKFGYEPQLAASPTGKLAVTSYSGGSFIDINDTLGRTWNRVVNKGDGGAGWNDIVYVTGREAWVVYSPIDQFEDFGQLYVTHDGGHHWHVVKP